MPRAPTSLLFRRARGAEEREGALRLLARRGGVPLLLREWCDDGELYVLTDLTEPAGRGPIGAAVVTPVVPRRTVELRTFATRSHDVELSLRMVGDVLDAVRASGASRAVAAASNADLERMALLQRAGFRYTHVERDAAIAARGWADLEGAIVSHDVLWFDRPL
ncbi:MAG: hypothetical protein QOI95_2250 [Acidimicrobiaceae bacterium]|jgi:hypothetical protein